MPEWVELCRHWLEVPAAYSAVYEGVAALRADRDHWRERATSYEGTIRRLTKPKPADDWRERCKLRRMPTAGYWDIESPSGLYFWLPGHTWRPQDPHSKIGCYRAEADARNALMALTTPPPDAAEGGTR